MELPLSLQQNQQPQAQSSTGYGLMGFVPSRAVSYQAPQVPQNTIPQTDPALISQAIKNNETGGVKDPYSFSQPSGAGDMANGAYQVRDSELQTYAPKYLGKSVTPQQFLSSPQMQDNYMNAKATHLAGRGLTAEQIMAAHRGGASDLTGAALGSLVKKYQPYVSKGMAYINQLKNPSPKSRSFGDLTQK